MHLNVLIQEDCNENEPELEVRINMMWTQVDQWQYNKWNQTSNLYSTITTTFSFLLIRRKY